MEANARHIEKIFDQTVCYQVPLFQRPYVWNQEENWEPLWEDIQRLLYLHMAGEKLKPHFIGAAVLEQMDNTTGSIQTRQVIDGQQRFTTLQTLMVVIRDICRELGQEKYVERFSDLVINKRSKVDKDEEVYKLMPTNKDRPDFMLIHEAGNAGAVRRLASQAGISQFDKGIAGAYLYFEQQVREWLAGEDGQGLTDPAMVVSRCEALWKIIGNGLLLVVIDLGNDDESQVIFETLNARGTQLLPADLIKNYLFRRAQAESENIEKLYEQYWKEFDTDFWREQVKQGREFRPRIDLFIRHLLTMLTCQDVRVGHIFNAYKVYAGNAALFGSSMIAAPESAADHVRLLSRFARHFRLFYPGGKHSRLAMFIQRLDIVDTTTVYPFLLLCCDSLLPEKQQEFDRILMILESYLFRRMICGLTTKNYNQIFLSLIKTVQENQAVTAAIVAEFLLSSDGISFRFPLDEEFQTAFVRNPIYKMLSQKKVRGILEAINGTLAHSKTEALQLPPGLTIEHVLPEKWQEHWPLPDDIKDDPELSEQLVRLRETLKHSIGNLTLITGSLNPVLSNSSWQVKKPGLLKNSKLNLTFSLHEPEVWDVEQILTRGSAFYEKALSIWPAIK